MAPRSPTPARIRAAIKSQREARRAEASFRSALRSFRPRKAERGEIVFLSARSRFVLKQGRRERVPAGRRVSESYRGLVYPVYVTKTGKVRPYKPRGTKGKAVKPVRVRKVDPLRFKSQRARKKAEKIVTPKAVRVVERATTKATTGLDVFGKVADRLIAQVERVDNLSRGAKTILVQTAVVVGGAGGAESFIVSTPLQISGGQTRRDPNQFRDWLETKWYAAIADELRLRGKVSSQSARRVAKLEINQGKPRSEWRNAKGGLWNKRNLEETVVRRIDTDALLVQFKSRPVDIDREPDDDNEPF